MVHRKPRWVCLKTANLKEAVTLRKKLVRVAQMKPFEDISALLRGELELGATNGGATKRVTIAEVIKKFEETSSIASATRAANALRYVLRRAGIADPDAANVAVLSSDTVAAYRRHVEKDAEQLAKKSNAKTNLVKRARLLRSAQSRLRQARQVFAKHLRPVYRAMGADVSGFLEGNVPAPAVVYEVPPQSILERIVQEFPKLEASEPDVFAAFLVGIGIGLRNSEAAIAEFDWIEKADDGTNFLRLTTREDSTTKTGRARWVPIPPAVLDSLQRVRGCMLTREKRLPPVRVEIVKSEEKYLIPGTSRTDRYNTTTRRLAKWLRAQGLDAARWPKAYYELRKLLGSLVAKRERSILAAAQHLGNQPTVSERYYVDALRGPVPTQLLEGLLAPAAAPIVEKKPSA